MTSVSLLVFYCNSAIHLAFVICSERVHEHCFSTGHRQNDVYFLVSFREIDSYSAVSMCSSEMSKFKLLFGAVENVPHYFCSLSEKGDVLQWLRSTVPK